MRVLSRPRPLAESPMAFRSKWQSLPTEAINAATLALDKLPAADIVELMMNEDRKVVSAVQREKERIALGAESLPKRSTRRTGRVRRRGTSGRLGVLESAEMPPTFGTDPTLVQAVMAGGRGATFKAEEGIEDNYEEGARSSRVSSSARRDVVIGVSASGMTPFVRGALTRARKAGCEDHIRHLRSPHRAPDVRRSDDRAGGRTRGDRGSTRLKAGTATKMVLNMLTTRDGPHRQDLRQPDGRRSDRIREAEGPRAPHRQHRHRPRYDEADKLLRRARWNVKAAIVMQKTGQTYPRALTTLRKAGGHLRDALGEDIEPRLRDLIDHQQLA